MKQKSKRWKVQRKIRKWANNNSELVYNTLGRKCNNCDTTEDLTIHHKEYKVGMEYLEILCNRCHNEFHDQELKKRLLLNAMDVIKQFEEVNEQDASDLKEWLQEKIDAIPIKIVPNLKIDGLPR